MLNVIFIACSILAQPGVKTPCKEVTLTVMTTQAYGVVQQPAINGQVAGYSSASQPEQRTPLNGATVYQEAEQLNAATCYKNGQFEIAKWAIANSLFTIKRGFSCAPSGQMAKA
jgi:hypothetical protein